MEKYQLEKYISVFNRHPHNNFALLVDGRIEYSILPCNYFSKIEYISNNDKYLAVFKLEEIIDLKTLVMYGKERLNYHNLFEYINSFLGSNSYQLTVVVNKIEIRNYKNSFSEIKKIEFNNFEVDEKFIKIINLYFANLIEIDFINCIINKSSNLNMLNCNINFKNCEIELLSSLNYCSQKISLSNTIIGQYNLAVINSKDMIINLNELELKKTMIYTNFPYLSNLEINGNDCLKESLNYISSACTNLKNLKINGIVYSLDFIYKINNINKCIINSVDDSIGTYEIITPEIENQNERNKIIKESLIEVNSGLDERLVIFEKINQIVKSMNLFKYSLYEMNLYMQQERFEDKIIIKNPFYKYFEINYSYDSNNHELFLDSNHDDLFEYNIVDSNIYISRKSEIISKYLSYKKILMKGIPFIYHANGTPIIFEKKQSFREKTNHAKSNCDFYNILCEDEIIEKENFCSNLFFDDDISCKGQSCELSFYDKDSNEIAFLSFGLDGFPYLNSYESVKDKIKYVLIKYSSIKEEINLVNIFSDNVEVVDDNFVRLIDTGKVFYGANCILNNNTEICDFVEEIIKIIKEEINLENLSYDNINKKINDFINVYYEYEKNNKKYIK